MTIHSLKTDPAAFDAVQDGKKTFEIRKDDRDYKVGDRVLLKRTKYTGAEMASGAPLEYTGKEIDQTITHILRGPLYGLADGWAILSIQYKGYQPTRVLWFGFDRVLMPDEPITLLLRVGNSQSTCP